MSDTLERHFGYWLLTQRRYYVSGSGVREQSCQLVWFGMSDDEVLVLPSVSTTVAPLGSELERIELEYAVVVRQHDFLPRGYGESSGPQDTDSYGFPVPERGVFVRRDTSTSEGRLVHREYLPVDQIYLSSALHTGITTRDVTMLRAGTTTVKAQVDASSYSGPGSLVLEEYDTLFSWLTLDVADFSFIYSSWRPGEAGPFKRLLLGSGLIDDDKPTWQVYALERDLVVECHRDNVLLSQRSLDCGPLIRQSYRGENYLIAFGYDWHEGAIALGVSMKGSASDAVYGYWPAPELRAFGYQQPVLYIGGGPVGHPQVPTYRSGWLQVRPLDGGFTTERFLSPGLMAQLSEHLP
jgi:hypothetical protein